MEYIAFGGSAQEATNALRIDGDLRVRDPMIALTLFWVAIIIITTSTLLYFLLLDWWLLYVSYSSLSLVLSVCGVDVWFRMLGHLSEWAAGTRGDSSRGGAGPLPGGRHRGVACGRQQTTTRETLGVLSNVHVGQPIDSWDRCCLFHSIRFVSLFLCCYYWDGNDIWN